MEKSELKGVWWLPENNENCVSGVLKFDSDKGAYLELMGQISEYDEFEINIILGKTSDGKDITLYKCLEMSKTFSSNGFPTTKVFANITFRGVHFKTEDEIKFNEISCHYSNLDEWAWMNGININVLSNEIEIKYKLPPKVSSDINEEYTIVVYPNTRPPSRCLIQKEATITQKVYVKVINKKLNSFHEHIKQLRHIQNFISLGIGEPSTIIDIVGKSEINKEKFNEQFFYPEIKVYIYNKQSPRERKQILPQCMLFSLKDIEDDFDDILKMWYGRKNDVLKPVIDLYFGTLYNSDMYLEQRFLSLVQAIESYHRRTKINNEIDPNEHENRVDNIINSVDSQYKEWLKHRLLYSNEPTLRKRLKEILDDCDTLLNLPSSRKKKSFICKICDTRNYFTHYDNSLVDRAARESELFEICEKLKIIIEFNLLIEIGFDKEMVYRLLKERYRNHNVLK